ncbi:MAG: hypothetical protein ACMXYB_01840 [Candidatus Woesearchaeota archaeon]
MVEKKEIKNELKKLNKELSEIIYNENLNIPEKILYNQEFDSDRLTFNELELLTLIQDVRDEISILRRNLFSDIESYTHKKINSQQEKFFEKIESSFSKILKESMISRTQHVKEIKNEFSQFHEKINYLEKEIGDIKTQNQIMTKIQEGIQFNQTSINTQSFPVQNQMDTNTSRIQSNVESRISKIDTALRKFEQNN